MSAVAVIVVVLVALLLVAMLVAGVRRAGAARAAGRDSALDAEVLPFRSHAEASRGTAERGRPQGPGDGPKAKNRPRSL